MKNLSLRAALLAAALILPVTIASAQDSGDAKKGKEAFLAYTCYGCHGFSGQNGPGMRLAPMKITARHIYQHGAESKPAQSHAALFGQSDHRRATDRRLGVS